MPLKSIFNKMLNKPPNRFGRFGPMGAGAAGPSTLLVPGLGRLRLPSVWFCLGLCLVLVVIAQMTVFSKAAGKSGAKGSPSSFSDKDPSAPCNEQLKAVLDLVEKKQAKIHALETRQRSLEDKLAAIQGEEAVDRSLTSQETEDGYEEMQGRGASGDGTKTHVSLSKEWSSDNSKAAPETEAAGATAGRSVAASGGKRGPEPAPADPSQARALLVICYNRPDYLKRTLDGVIKNLPAYNRPHIYVSQDGSLPGVTSAIEDAKRALAEVAPDVPFTHLQHTQDHARNANKPWGSGYYYLAQHFGWALNQVFNDRQHPRVIVLEDDIDIAPDFFNYFTAMEPLLDRDPTLLAASAWNDLGQAHFVSDPKRVYRSDFFPGLGWMLTKRTWSEIGPKWPDSFWDDWLREPPQRKERAFLRPEVSRTFTFGVSGVSQAQFYDQYLGNIKLNDQKVDWSAPSLTEQLSERLDKPAYDAWLRTVTLNAKEVPLNSLLATTCDAATGQVNIGGRVALGNDGAETKRKSRDVEEAEDGLPTVKALYSTFDGPGGYAMAARAMGFIDDVKAGVPRTAYKGVTVVIHNGCRKLLVDADKQAKL